MIWNVSNDDQTKDDVKSLARNKNQKYIKITDDGSVTLDFGNLDAKSAKKLLAKDKGLALINDLVNADENYYYTASTENIFKDRNTGEITKKIIPSTETVLSQISNYSITPRNIGTDFKSVGLAPGLPGIDGYVRLSPGDFSLEYQSKDEKGYTIALNNITGLRTSTLFHELGENYARTTLKMPYERKDGSGAH